MALATYTVNVGWEATPGNAFVLDASRLDGPSVLTSRFSDLLDVIQFGISSFGSADAFADQSEALFVSVTADVKSVATRRGRGDNLDSFQAGEAVVTLADPDGLYNPLNPDSELAPNVVPGRPIKIEASYAGASYGLFRGFVRSIEHDPSPGVKETKITCQDLFLYLSRAKPTISALASPTTTGEAIEAVLNTVGWENPNLYELDEGDTFTETWEATGQDTGLGLIQKLLEAERGTFIHGADGVVRYQDRYSRYRRSTVATFSGEGSSVAPATDLTNVRNRASVKANGGTAQVAEDELSVQNYGPSDFSAIDSPYIETDAQAQALAQWLVLQAADPQPPVRELSFLANASDALMQKGLALEVGDRVTVDDAAAGVPAQSFFVEGVAHEVASSGTRHLVSIALSKVPTYSPIVFGSSAFGNLDVFVY